ncbi:MAG: hypothetical protein LC792_07660 [Actinobacteria bacterium]|nr:hypothetical protein [Actinomycetota bacterium]
MSALKINEPAWQAIADELAAALRTTMLRNPTVSALDWDRAQAALGRYEMAGGAVPAALPEQPDA